MKSNKKFKRFLSLTQAFIMTFSVMAGVVVNPKTVKAAVLGSADASNHQYGTVTGKDAPTATYDTTANTWTVRDTSSVFASAGTTINNYGYSIPGSLVSTNTTTNVTVIAKVNSLVSSDADVKSKIFAGVAIQDNASTFDTSQGLLSFVYNASTTYQIGTNVITVAPSVNAAYKKSTATTAFSNAASTPVASPSAGSSIYLKCVVSNGKLYNFYGIESNGTITWTQQHNAQTLFTSSTGTNLYAGLVVGGAAQGTAAKDVTAVFENFAVYNTVVGSSTPITGDTTTLDDLISGTYKDNLVAGKVAKSAPPLAPHTASNIIDAITVNSTTSPGALVTNIVTGAGTTSYTATLSKNYAANTGDVKFDVKYKDVATPSIKSITASVADSVKFTNSLASLTSLVTVSSSALQGVTTIAPLTIEITPQSGPTASNAAGEDTPVTLTITKEAADIPKPTTAPSTFVATAAAAGTVQASWNAVPTATSYIVYYSKTNAIDVANSATFASKIFTATSGDITGLDNNTTYYFKIAAANDAGSSNPSATAISATTIPVALAAPADFKLVSNTETSLNVSWAAVTGANYYTLEYAKQGDTTFTPTGNNITGTTATISGLTADTTYNLKLYSNVISKTDSSVVLKSAPATASLATKAPINLDIWNADVFGNIGGEANKKYYTITPSNAGDISGTVAMKASLNGSTAYGKIEKASDGFGMYYKKLDASDDFELKATVKTNAIPSSLDGQEGFGLMVKNDLGLSSPPAFNATAPAAISNAVYVGGFQRLMMMGFRTSKTSPTLMGALTTADADYKTYMFSNSISQYYELNTTYNLTLKKLGGVFTATCNGKTLDPKDFTGLFTDDMYVGLFIARNCTVTFSDISLTVAEKLTSISITKQPTKTTYFVGDVVDYTGLEVSGTTTSGATSVLSANDYAATPVNMSTPGKKTVVINSGGQTASFEITVVSPKVTQMTVENIPSKTLYHLGEELDFTGMAISAAFENGKTGILTPADYTVSGYDKTKAGVQTIILTAVTNSAMTATLSLTVSGATLSYLSIERQPVISAYFIGALASELDFTGLTVAANYSDRTISILKLTDYTIDTSSFDSSAVKVLSFPIRYQTASINLPITIKNPAIKALTVTTYPQTTIYTGSTFNPTGMVVSNLYVDGSTKARPASEYTIDTSAVNTSVPGQYNVLIKPIGVQATPATLKVTVRATKNYVWDFKIFGQSTTAKGDNAMTFTQGDSKTDIESSAFTIQSLNNSGKITGSHDGISYYCTPVNPKDNFELSADIHVVSFSPPTSYSGQEAFGIMARDTADGQIGVVDASNLAFVGGFSGGSYMADGSRPLGTQGVFRPGIIGSDANGAITDPNYFVSTTPKKMLDSTYPSPEFTASNYRLTLIKNNSGYSMKLNDKLVSFEDPTNALAIQDPNNIYLGFFTAREAKIDVSNVKFYVSDPATDAPPVAVSGSLVVPTMTYVSAAASSTEAYILNTKTTAGGYLSVKQNDKDIVSNMRVDAGATSAIYTKLTIGENNFRATLIPDTAQLLTSYEPVIVDYKVIYQTVNPTLTSVYVAPNGSINGNGSIDKPYDIYTGLYYAKPGQHIIARGGTYKLSQPISIPATQSGTQQNPVKFTAYPNEKPILDFQKISAGFELAASNWYIFGIDVTRTKDNIKGLTIGGNYNTIELCNTYGNGDTGLQISRLGTSNLISEWPHYNTILNCTSYDNADPGENNADGFGCKLTVGEGNRFIGCISHNNADDGWDFYTKAESGPIGAGYIENCISYENGKLTGQSFASGGGNGFKLGGENIGVKNTIKNSIAFGNKGNGITSNSNPKMAIYDVFLYNNLLGNINLYTKGNATLDYTVEGVISYKDANAPSANTEKDIPADKNNSTRNYYYVDGASKNKDGKAFTASEFTALALPSKTGLETRLSDGSLNTASFWDNYYAFAGSNPLAKSVKSIAAIPAITVPIGANNFTNLLPTTIAITLSDDSVYQANIVWDMTDIRILYTPDSFDYFGDLKLDPALGYSNPSGLRPTVHLNVIANGTTGGSSTDGKGTGNSTGTTATTTTTTPSTPSTPSTTPKVETTATVTSGIAKAVIEATKAVLEKAVSAVQEVGKQDVKSVEIAMAVPQAADTAKVASFDLSVSPSTISEIKSLQVNNMVLNLGEIKISLPMLVVNQATANNNAPISVAVEKVDVAKTTDSGLRFAAGSGDVYQLELHANNTTFNSKFEKMVTVTLPYTLKPNEKADHIAVYMYNPTSKNLEPRAGNYDAKTKTVKFDTISFSTYVVKSDDVTFGDLGTSEWARAFIETMASKGIISGRSAGVYDPQANITRAEFASLLVRMLGGLDTTAKATYTDVTESNPYYATIGSLQKLGLKMGGRTTGIFDPSATITREEMFDLIGQAMVSKGYKKVDASTLNKFTDKSDISAYAADNIALLVNEKIVSGRTATTIVPKATTTRAEAATMLYQIMNK